jgi:hypothetical protein
MGRASREACLNVERQTLNASNIQVARAPWMEDDAAFHIRLSQSHDGACAGVALPTFPIADARKDSLCAKHRTRSGSREIVSLVQSASKLIGFSQTAPASVKRETRYLTGSVIVLLLAAFAYLFSFPLVLWFMVKFMPPAPVAEVIEFYRPALELSKDCPPYQAILACEAKLLGVGLLYWRR